MNQSSPEHLIHQYLEQVERELQDRPPAERAEIRDDLYFHIVEAVGEPASASEADVRNALDRLGHPQDVAFELRGRAPEAAEEPRSETVSGDKTPGALEVAAIILTALFWPIGVLLAWISQRWLTRDKVIATGVPFLATLMLGVIVLGGLVVWGAGATTTQVFEHSQPAAPPVPSEREPGAEPPPEPRSPTEISDVSSSGGAVSRLVVALVFLGGVVAGPFAAAVYLAIRLQPIHAAQTRFESETRPSAPTGKGRQASSVN